MRRLSWSFYIRQIGMWGERSMAGLCWRSRSGLFNRLWIWRLAKKWMGSSLRETSMTVRYRLWMPLSFLIRPWHVWSWRSRFLFMLSVAITMGLNVCILGETFFNLRAFIWAHVWRRLSCPSSLRTARFSSFPLLILLMPVFTIRTIRIRRFRGLVMPWPTFSRIWKKPLILTRPIFWWRILRFLRRMIVMVKVYGNWCCLKLAIR